MNRRAWVLCVVALASGGCKKSSEGQAPKAGARHVVGLVTDIGGRGDHSFNDSALRGLELWAAGKKFEGGDYQDASAAERTATVPPELIAQVTPVPVQPLVIQSKSQEDYEPNLQLLVDQGAELIIG